MSRRKLRVLVLCHESLVPPPGHGEMSVEARDEFRTESDVVRTLGELGHKVQVVGLYDELAHLRRAIAEFQPDVAVNSMEEFGELTVYDHNVVSYLELMRVPYTGCNPRGLVLGRDKALSKKILSYHRIRAPRFGVFRMGRAIRRPKGLEFPLIVKSLTEDASVGISQASVVNDDTALAERVSLIHRRIQTHAIAEQYIDGLELYVGVIGNDRLQALPVWELSLDQLPPDANRIATRRAKWDRGYQRRHGIRLGPAEGLSPEVQKGLARTSKRIYRALSLSGYARIDFRLDGENRFYFLEANPNPELSDVAEMAKAAGALGWSYGALLKKIVNLGRRSLER